MAEVRDYRMALHIHTRYSDGSGFVREIVATGREAGLDVLVISDHNTLAARSEGWAGWHGSSPPPGQMPEPVRKRKENGVDAEAAEGAERRQRRNHSGVGRSLRVGVSALRGSKAGGERRILVIVADEVTPAGRAHVLALGLRDVTGLEYLSEPAYLERVARAGGLSILAHPQGKPDIGLSLSSQPWFHWQDPNYHALELWSYMHDWVKDLRWWQLPGACLRPDRRIRGPDRHLLSLWDRLLRERTITGVAALDAHAPQVVSGLVRILPYRDLFRTTLTHILAPPMTGDAEQDERAVMAALRDGRAYVTFEVLAPVERFTFIAERGSSRWLPISRLPAGRPVTLLAEAPEVADIRLIHDSQVQAQASGTEAAWKVSEPGVYRVEAYLGGRPWILSNPICLT